MIHVVSHVGGIAGFGGMIVSHLSRLFFCVAFCHLKIINHHHLHLLIQLPILEIMLWYKISSDESDICDKLEDVDANGNAINVDNDNTNITNTDNQQKTDISSKKETMNMCFSSLALSQGDEM